MCLNCLPYFEKCVFCVSLKAAALLISLSGLICTTLLIVLTYVNKTGLSSEGSVNYSLWFICIMILWLVTFMILFIGWTGLVKNETACDMLLQIYFWFSVVNGVIQLIFCAMLFISFWNGALTVPIVYISITLLVFCEVYTCCFIPARLAMVLISILAIMTGFLVLSTMLKNSDISYKKVQILGAIKKIDGRIIECCQSEQQERKKGKDPKDAINKLSTLVKSGICMMSCVFMITGLLLLVGSLTDNDGFIQLFVWVTFLNVVFGYLLVLGVGYECLMKSSCTLSEFDWLSGSAFLVFLIGYLSLWIYFISIANSHVMSVEG